MIGRRKRRGGKGRPPRTAEKLLHFLASRRNRSDILGDAEEEYRGRRALRGRLRADLWYLSQLIIPLPFFMRATFIGSIAILRSYVKSAWRTMRRHKAFTLINTAGLALGMGCFILTMVWARYEHGYDGFHKKGDRIHRLINTQPTVDGHESWAEAPPPLGPHLRANYPEVVSFTRFRSERFYWRLQIEDAVVFNTWRVAYADPALLDMFDFPLASGDPGSALDDAASVVISEKVAKTYFGSRDPMGKKILFMAEKIPMLITGVMRDIPANSHVRFDFLLNIRSLGPLYDCDATETILENWSLLAYGLYIQLETGASADEFESRIASILPELNPDADFRLSLQSLRKIHLYSGSLQDSNTVDGGEIRTVRLFLSISFMVLLIACVNFMSLAAARSLKRTREVGIRKISGAYRSDIVKQFMGESLLHSFTALSLALILAAALLPTIEKLTGRALDFNLLSIWPLLLSVLGVTFLTGLISGIYPAIFASAWNPVQALKDMADKRGMSFMFMRRGLVAAQFICTSVLLIVSLIILAQLRYLKTKDLGYDSKNIAVFSVGGLRNNLEAFKTKLREHPQILQVAAGAAPTWGKQGHRFGDSEWSHLDWEGKPDDGIVMMDMHFADYDFLEILSLKVLDGRWFSRKFGGDSKNYALNRSAVKLMGLSDPVGKWFKFGAQRGTIIGVVEDFHTGTLHNKIAPTLFICQPNLHVMARIGPRNVPGALAYIEKTWKEFVPERPIRIRWLDERLNNFYSSDRKLGRIVTNYTGLSLFISCLGLLGLVSFLAEHKTKEIGVRKVLGAPVASVIALMAREYIVILGLSSLIAWPIGYLIASRWLSGFAYNTGIAFWIFPAALGTILLFASLAVGYKTLKAARMNPVEALRYE